MHSNRCDLQECAARHLAACCHHVTCYQLHQAGTGPSTHHELTLRPTCALPCRFIQLYCSMGFFPCYSPLLMLPAIAAVCAACTVVESLPVNSVLDDNLTVPVVAALMSMALMPLVITGSAAVSMDAAPAAAAAFGWLSG